MIVCGVALRIFLSLHNWPQTNSDEATIGLMARHIVNLGEHPIFFYGQQYMGALEAYLAAPFFVVLGSSLFSLRLSLIFLFAGFLICLYLFSSLVYSKGWALVSLSFLSFGSSFVIARQLSAIGGYPELLFFGSLLFLLASYLALTQRKPQASGKHYVRYCLYGAWGLAAGLGLWSDLLLLPFVLCSGLIVVLFCWADLRRIGSAGCLVIGSLIGMWPLIYYNLHAAPGKDSLTTLLQLRQGGSSESLNVFQAMWGTVSISVPMITGEPLCPIVEKPAWSPASAMSLNCTIIRGGWGLGLLLLFFLSFSLALFRLWSLRVYFDVKKHGAFDNGEGRQQLIRLAIHMLILISAACTLMAYMFSPSPIDWPGSRARYLTGLLIALPALGWPLWVGLQKTVYQKTGQGFMVRSICLGLLGVICLSSLLGSFLIFWEIPAAQQNQDRQQGLIAYLNQRGITHIYTDYWTCNRLAFLSEEHIICGVVDQHLQESLDFNRYAPYYERVKADRRSAYLFPHGFHVALPEKDKLKDIFEYNGYILYQLREP
ncbi:hypothetical protein KTT_46180 [Tengunoibacter tsumagoiensis]|uniref:Glycosyltransferase RgtA/B/C/D-like domain-containing protein n=2 Tax=Tengunoibacter tsumagoiensis TaxID=2014871 RepID=A0A402A6P3_9CHLR|nr:hypothetical protein KTT_46180 [Tengunoibacter tsumagoiensis]